MVSGVAGHLGVPAVRHVDRAGPTSEEKICKNKPCDSIGEKGAA